MPTPMYSPKRGNSIGCSPYFSDNATSHLLSATFVGDAGVGSAPARELGASGDAHVRPSRVR